MFADSVLKQEGKSVSDQNGLRSLTRWLFCGTSWDAIARRGTSCGTFMHLAASRGNVAFVRWAFEGIRYMRFHKAEVKAMINSENSKGHSALEIAVEVEQEQRGPLGAGTRRRGRAVAVRTPRTIVAGQNDHLVAMHSQVAQVGLVIRARKTPRVTSAKTHKID